MKFFHSIKFRLTLWYLGFLVLVLFFFSATSYIAMSQITRHTVRNIYTTRNLAFDVNVLSSRTDVPETDNISDFMRFYSFTLTEEKYQEIFASDSYLQPVSTYFGKIYIDLRQVLPEDIEIGSKVSFSGQVLQRDPEILHVVMTVNSDAEIMAAIAAFKQSLYISIPVTLLLAGILGYFLVKHNLKPIDIIRRSAAGVQREHPGSRIPVNSRDELGSLSAELNETFDRLAESLARERQFTSEASHELRIPLTILRNETTIALNQPRSVEEYQRTLISVSQDIDRMSFLINQLLELSRADNCKDQLNSKRIDLTDLLFDIAGDFTLLAEQKNIDFKTGLDITASIIGDEIKLRRIFSNLLDNALKYTPLGGNIQLSLSREDNYYKVEISDTGKGIKEEHLPHIFERFYRADKFEQEKPKGLGLGLAISKYFAEAHGGYIEVESRLGFGSKFRVFLPITGPDGLSDNY